MPALAPATEKPLRISAVCAEGDHSACLGTVYVWPIPTPDPGQYLVKCECPTCVHKLLGGPYRD